MESRWYLAHGQTLENTAISNRGHALHATASAWKNITAHLDRNRLEAEVIQKERDYKTAMKEGSRAITKNWIHCSLNTEERLAKERKQREEELEERRMKEYLEIRKEQEEIREQYIQKVKRSLFYEKAQPRQLNGALLESEAIYERGKQIEFNRMLKQREREEEKIFADKVKAAAEQEKQENLMKKQEDMKKKNEMKELYLKEMAERKASVKEYRAKRTEKERIDNINVNIELAMQEKIKQEDALKARTERKADLLKYIGVHQAFEKQLKKEEAEVDEVIQIFNEAKTRMECLRKEKDKEIIREQVEQRIAAVQKAESDLGVKEALSEQAFKKIQEEHKQKDEEKYLQKIEKARQMREDRENDRKAFLKKHAERMRKEEEIKRWELLNRQKKEEVMKEYNEEKRKKNTEAVEQYRKDLLEQIEANKIRDIDGIDDAAAADAHYNATLEKQDQEFFEYADELLEHCKNRGRSTLPIKKVIQDYKIQNSMTLPPNRNCIPFEEAVERQGNMLNTEPGKMSHNPHSDPNYNKCRCWKDWIIR